MVLKGCDASILISTKPGSKILAEKDAEDNKDLAMEAFDSINKAKALVESKCPGVVSCSDILAIAARDFVHLVSLLLLFIKKGRFLGNFCFDACHCIDLMCLIMKFSFSCPIFYSKANIAFPFHMQKIWKKKQN